MPLGNVQQALQGLPDLFLLIVLWLAKPAPVFSFGDSLYCGP